MILNKYRSAMDRITMSDELRQKIISASGGRAKKKRRIYISAAAGLAACLVIGVISYKVSKPNETATDLVSVTETELPLADSSAEEPIAEEEPTGGAAGAATQTEPSARPQAGQNNNAAQSGAAQSVEGDKNDVSQPTAMPELRAARKIEEEPPAESVPDPADTDADEIPEDIEIARAETLPVMSVTGSSAAGARGGGARGGGSAAVPKPSPTEEPTEEAEEE